MKKSFFNRFFKVVSIIVSVLFIILFSTLALTAVCAKNIAQFFGQTFVEGLDFFKEYVRNSR
jgi:hypothetical protein